MTEQEQNEFVKNIETKMRQVSINSVANGYRAAWTEILDMLHSGKTKKQIEEYANLMLQNNDKLVEVAIDKDVNK